MKLKPIAFDVQRAFDNILKESESKYVRAVRLFELQVAMVACRGSGDADVGSAFTINVDRNIIRAARIHASLKMLQHAIDDDEGSFAALLKDPDVQKLLKRFLTQNGDLNRTRYAMRAPKLKNKIGALERICKDVAKLAHFSCRFELSETMDRRRKGGVTSALNVITDTANKDFRANRSFSSLKADAKRYEPVFGLLYLGYIEGLDIRPLNIRGNNFAEKLLKGLDSERGPLAIARRYSDVRARLTAQNYLIPSLDVGQIAQHSITYPALPEDIVEIIRRKSLNNQ